MWYWIIGLLLLVLALAGLWFGLTNRLDRGSERIRGSDRETAEAMERIRREIDRGRGAGQGFIP